MGDEMYLEDFKDRVMRVLSVALPVFFLLVVAIGILAWLFTGDVDVLLRTSAIVALSIMALLLFFNSQANAYRPSPPDGSHPDMDIWTDDEL